MKYQVSFRAKTWLSSHVKITCFLDTWKGHRCYGYITNRAFYHKRTIELKRFSVLLVFIKYIAHEQAKYFSTREKKFRISARPCNILSKGCFDNVSLAIGHWACGQIASHVDVLRGSSRVPTPQERVTCLRQTANANLYYVTRQVSSLLVVYCSSFLHLN